MLTVLEPYLRETNPDSHGLVSLDAPTARVIVDKFAFERQRLADWKHVGAIADMMLRGEWRPMSQITFVRSGTVFKLVDAQHRLRAQAALPDDAAPILSTVAALSTRAHCARCDPSARNTCPAHPRSPADPQTGKCLACVRRAGNLESDVHVMIGDGRTRGEIAHALGQSWPKVACFWKAAAPDLIRRGQAVRARRRAETNRRIREDYTAGESLAVLAARYKVGPRRMLEAVPQRLRRRSSGGRPPASDAASPSACAARDARILALHREGWTQKRIVETVGASPPAVARAIPAAERRPGRNTRTLAIDELATYHRLRTIAERYAAGETRAAICRDMGVPVSLFCRAVPFDHRRQAPEGRVLLPEQLSEALRRSIRARSRRWKQSIPRIARDLDLSVLLVKRVLGRDY